MFLRYVAPDGTAADIPFDAPVAIGRARDAQIPLLHPSVSRAHAALESKDGAIVLRDLNSRNGVYVNGHKIADRVLLKDGDKLQIGELRFVLALDATAERPATLFAVADDKQDAAAKKPEPVAAAPQPPATSEKAAEPAAAPTTPAAASEKPAAPAKPAKKKIVFKLK